MLNSFWHSYWTFAISSFESCMIHTICEPEGTHAEVHQTISHIVLLFQIKKNASFWFCGTDPFLESSSVSITELQKDDHRSLDPSWSSYAGSISFPQHTSTKPVSQSPFCRWLTKKKKKTQRNGSDPLIPINPALLQFILSIRGELMVFGWAHWNMSDSFHKD